jgi:hypothetical protein
MLNAMHITGSCNLQGSTGDVVRLVGSGQVWTLEPDVGGGGSPVDAAFMSMLTLTSATTYQEIGELWLGAPSNRLSFVTIGSGYLIDSRASRRRTAVSLSRSTPPDGKEVRILSSLLVFDPLDHTCEITAIFFGVLPNG